MLRAHILGGAVLGCLVGGCVESGLSPRESRGRDYSSYLYSMYEPVDAQPTTTPARLALPARVAVAQVGEVAPPQAMLDALRKDPTAFAIVEPIPGIGQTAAVNDVRAERWEHVADAKLDAQAQTKRMLAYARSLGAEYVFMFGGTIDRSTSETPATLADITIVGMFVVPSREIRAEVKAAGSLVDVQTGRIVLSVSADATDKRASPKVAQEADEIKLLQSLRDKVTVKLAEQLGARIKEQPMAVKG